MRAADSKKSSAGSTSRIWRSVIAIDLVAASFFGITLLDRELAFVLYHVQGSPIITVAAYVPDFGTLGLFFIAGFLFLAAFRFIAGDRRISDRALFVLGSGAVSGFAADLLKLVFGRTRPEAYLREGVYDFNFFGLNAGLDSFPSSHAAITAGFAGALAALFPNHRAVLMMIAGTVASTRVLVGEHYFSDALFGFGTGLGISLALKAVLPHFGILLEPPSQLLGVRPPGEAR
jgi:membrane-associated phospholipid phosphatase